MKSILIFCSLTLISYGLCGQSKFNYRYGSTYTDRPRKIIQTYDDNFIIVGETEGFGSAKNAFAQKIDTSGNILWLKDYEGINDDVAWDLLELANHHLVICGSTYSYGIGGTDAFIIETDDSGNVLWSKVYGTIDWEEFYKICPDAAGGYFVAGYGKSAVSYDEGTVVARIDSIGNLIWSQWLPAWDHQGDWWPVDLAMVRSGGCVVAGYGGGASISCWKFSISGSIEWSSKYQRSSGAQQIGTLGIRVAQNLAGDFFINTTLSDTSNPAHSLDIGLIKTDSSGNLVWVKSYGGIYNEFQRSISSTSDSSLILCGYTNSYGNGDFDHCLIKVDQNGNVDWARAYGTIWLENSYDAIECRDHGYILTGQTWSTGTVIGDSSKINVIKTDSLGYAYCNTILWNPIIVDHTINVSFAEPPENLPLQVGVDVDWNVLERVFYSISNCSLIGVDEIDNINNFSVFPNPATDVVNIKIASAGIQSIEFFNSIGEIIYSEFTSINKFSEEVSVKKWNPGIYFVKFQTADGSVVKKLIVQ